MRLKFIPIGLKLISTVSLILILALGVVIITASIYYGGDVERSTKFNTLERADLVAQKLESEMGSLENLGRLVAASMEGGIVYQGTGKSVTAQLLAQDSSVLMVWILDRQTGMTELKLNAASRDNLEATGLTKVIQSLETKENKTDFMGVKQVIQNHNSDFDSAFAGVNGLINLSQEFQSPVLGLTFPLNMKNPGEADTVVTVVFSQDKIINSLKSRELYQNFLIDSRGRLLAHTDTKLVIARPILTSEPIVKDCLTSSVDLKQLRYKNKDNISFFGSFKRFDGGRLAVISIVREDTAMATVYEVIRRNFLITILVVCAAMIFFFFFSKSLTKPIKRLSKGALLIKEGQFNVAIPVTSRDEIGRLTTTFTEMGKGLAEREKIKTAFGKFVNKEIAERVLRDEISLGGESKQATIFFSDIRSFTAISEKLTPHEVVEFLNDYMTRMVRCVNETNGVVDKFIGDAIMAVWGAPYSKGNDTENAVNGALMMRLALMDFNKDRGTDRKPKLRIGCGINSGEVVAGQIGSTERMEYTVIGDAVNLASRIEALNKPFHTDILISESSYENVKDIFAVEPMKKIMVKGKTDPQQIYAVIGRLDDPNRPSSLKAVRDMLGVEDVDVNEVDAEKHEEKYEIVE